MGSCSTSSAKSFLAFAVAICLYIFPSINSAQDNVNSKTYKSGYSQVWKAVMQAMNEGGDTVQNQDKDSGTIGTDWTVIKEADFLSRGWQAKQNILIEKISNSETKVTLKLIYQNKVLGAGSWSPASSDNDYTPKINKGFFDFLDKKLNSRP